MAGLVPAIHDLLQVSKTWMPGPRPGMTSRESCAFFLVVLVLKRGAACLDRPGIFLDLARHEAREIVRAASCRHRDAKPVGLEPLTHVLRVQRVGKRTIESANEGGGRVLRKEQRKPYRRVKIGKALL